MEIEVGISHLRDTLGIAVQHVPSTDDGAVMGDARRKGAKSQRFAVGVFIRGSLV